jgi:hypothetical protein
MKTESYIRETMLKQKNVRRCPRCDEPFIFHLTISAGSVKRVDTVVEKLLSEGRPFDEPRLGSDLYAVSPFECPSCDAFVQIMLKVEVADVVIPAPEVVARMDVKRQPKVLTADEKQLYAEWQSSGIIASLHSVFKEINPSSIPNRLDRFLKVFFNKCTLLENSWGYAAELGVSEVDFQLWHFSGVVAVIVKDEMRGFISAKRLKKRIVPSRIRPVRVVNDCAVEQWIKTRNGYIVGHGSYFGEMKKRAAGEFAKAVVNY